MRTLTAVATMAAAVLAGNAQAQTTFVWPAPAAPSTAQSVRYFLPMGTPLMLRTRTQVNTKVNKVGDRVYLEVAEPVSFRGQIVIPVGSPVIAEVAQVQRNGHFGVKGKVTVNVLQVETPSGPVRVTGTSYDEGKSGTALSIGTIALVSTLGFLVHGTSGDIPAQTVVQAYLAEPLNFRWQRDAGEQGLASLQASPDSAGKTSASLSGSQALADPAG
jgi:hypothetical protein